MWLLEPYNITLSLGHLLDLVPHFRAQLEEKLEPRPAPSSRLLNPVPNPNLRDEHCHVLSLPINGQHVLGVVIDDMSGVNVISEATCRDLGISDWARCPFHIRMVDTSAVKLSGLLKDLPILVGGETFQLSTVVLLHLTNNG